MNKGIIVGLAAVAALLVAVAVFLVGGDRLSGMLSDKNDGPKTIMIVSRDVLKSSAIAFSENDAADALVNNSSSSAAKPAGNSVSQKSADDKAQAREANFLISSMEDAIGGKVSEAFQKSRRFSLVPQASLVDAMQNYAKDNNIPPESMMSFVTGSISMKTKQAGGNKPAQESSSNSEQKDQGFSQGLTKVARKLGADFTLVISIGEPSMTWDIIQPKDGQPGRFLFSARPIVNCEIFDGKAKYAFRMSRQLDHIVTVNLDLSPNMPVKGAILAAYHTFNDRLASATAHMVLEWALDNVAPARIVRDGSKLIINRGTNDGIAEGTVYKVVRETGEDVVEDGGFNLGKLRVPVGSIVIDSAQEQISTAKPAEPATYLKGDIVVVANAPATSAVPAAAEGKPSTITVAVDHVTQKDGDKISDSDELGDAVSVALTRDARISVLSRAQMAKIEEERRRNGQASGELGLSADEGMLQSGYLVFGQCENHSQTHNDTISMGGVSKTVSSHKSTTSNCTLRATSVKGQLITAADGTGATADEAAAAAANALLPKLLASVGIASAQQAATPAPAPAAAPAPVAAAPEAPAPVRHKAAKAPVPAEEGPHF